MPAGTSPSVRIGRGNAARYVLDNAAAASTGGPPGDIETSMDSTSASARRISARVAWCSIWPDQKPNSGNVARYLGIQLPEPPDRLVTYLPAEQPLRLRPARVIQAIPHRQPAGKRNQPRRKLRIPLPQLAEKALIRQIRRRPRRRHRQQRLKKPPNLRRRASEPQLLLPRQLQTAHGERQLRLRQRLEISGDHDDGMRGLQPPGTLHAADAAQPVTQSQDQIAAQPDNPALSIKDAQHRIARPAGCQRQSTTERPVQRSHCRRIHAQQHNRITVAKGPAHTHPTRRSRYRHDASGDPARECQHLARKRTQAWLMGRFAGPNRPADLSHASG